MVDRMGTSWNATLAAVCACLVLTPAAKAAGDMAGMPASSRLTGTVTMAGDRNDVLEQQADQAEPVGYEPILPESTPGRMGGSACGGSSHVPIVECTNSWSASGFRGKRYRSVGVGAGAYARNPESGLLYIVRNDFPRASTMIGGALVPQSGPVRITGAPLGARGSARVWDAHIKFKGTHGTYGYLDLADNSVHVTGGSVPGECPAGTTGTPPVCEIDEAELGAIRVTPKNRQASPGEQVVLVSKIRNTGRAAAEDLRTCVEAPRRLVRVEKWCRRAEDLAAGEEASLKFPVTIKLRAERGQRIVVGFEATAATTTGFTGTRHAQARIRVR